jgi:hypothetical protein
VLFLYQNAPNFHAQKMTVREKISKKMAYSLGDFFFTGIAAWECFLNIVFSRYDSFFKLDFGHWRELLSRDIGFQS